jgi:microcystin-dependent protein
MATRSICDNLIKSTKSNVNITNLNSSNAVLTVTADASSSISVLLPSTSNVKFSGIPFSTILSNSIQSGIIIMWYGTTIPSGWVICDGTQGTPNLSGRFVLSPGNGYTVGSTGGSSTQTLTTANLPQHTHSGTTGSMDRNSNHAHSVPTGVVGDQNWTGLANQIPPADSSILNSNPQSYNSNDANIDHTHTFTTDTGSGLNSTAFSILPNYYVLTFIMKL